MSRSDASTPATDSLKVTLIWDKSSRTPPGAGSITVTVGGVPCAAAGQGATNIAARAGSHIILRRGSFIAAIATDWFYDCLGLPGSPTGGAVGGQQERQSKLSSGAFGVSHRLISKPDEDGQPHFHFCCG